MKNDKLNIFKLSNVTVAIGPNGCGKSRWLREIAENSNVKTIAIATSYDHKFKYLKNKYLSILTPTHKEFNSQHAMENIFYSLSKDNGKFRYQIERLLEYIGYDSWIGLEFSGTVIEADLFIDN